MFALELSNAAFGRTKPGDASRGHVEEDGGILLLWRSSAYNAAGGFECERTD